MTRQSDQSRALAVPSNRLHRFSKLGGMTAGIAGNMAVNGIAQLGQGQRPSMRNLLLTPRNVSRVAEQLAQMRGAAMKIGQLMSMDSGDVLPPELAQIMARLRNDAHFMPPTQLKQVLNAAWPDGWLKSFKHFDVRPIAAASIGQVHRAQLKDGRDLAIKIQYPGVAKSIDSDVANVGTLMKLSGLLPKGFELAPYLEEARKQLHEETDYAREGAELQRFADFLSNHTDFRVPEMHADWSTPNILAMSYVAGTPIEEMMQASQATSNAIALKLIDLTLTELFTFGAMQTDPNFANYLYDTETNQIILLDFGAARDIDPTVLRHYKALLKAGLAQDATSIAETTRAMGFVTPNTSDSHKAQVFTMIETVFAALHAMQPYDFTDDTLSKRMEQLGRALAEDGFVPPPLPIDVLLLQRKFGGMFLLAKRLAAKVDVIGLLEKHLANPA